MDSAVETDICKQGGHSLPQDWVAVLRIRDILVPYGFTSYFCLIIAGSGSGSLTRTNGSGSGRPGNIRILRIRIRNTGR
jgi:hypothetical protein